MQIFLNILFLVIGMVLLIKGADFFVDGASSVAKKLKVPTLFIGLTIVALGTSLPELSVSVASAVKNSIDMSVGNIVGSNMMNMLLILGIVILIKPVPISKSSKKVDFPFLIGITLLLLLFCADIVINRAGENIITRSESIILIATLLIYIVMLIANAKKEQKIMFNEGANYIEQPKEDKKTKKKNQKKEKQEKIKVEEIQVDENTKEIKKILDDNEEVFDLFEDEKKKKKKK